MSRDVDIFSAGRHKLSLTNYDQSPEPKSTSLPFLRSSMMSSIVHGSYLYPGG